MHPRTFLGALITLWTSFRECVDPVGLAFAPASARIHVVAQYGNLNGCHTRAAFLPHPSIFTAILEGEVLLFADGDPRLR